METVSNMGSLGAMLGLAACVVVGYLIVSWLIDFVRDRASWKRGETGTAVPRREAAPTQRAKSRGQGDFMPEQNSGDFTRDRRNK